MYSVKNLPLAHELADESPQFNERYMVRNSARPIYNHDLLELQAEEKVKIQERQENRL